MTNTVPTPFEFDSINFQSFDVDSLVQQLLGSVSAARDGRTSRTIAKSQGLTVVLTVLRAGQSLAEHAAPGPVAIVAVRGAATFTSGTGSQAVVTPGRILMMGPDEKHMVQATEDSAFLVVIGSQSRTAPGTDA